MCSFGECKVYLIGYSDITKWINGSKVGCVLRRCEREGGG